MRYRLIVAVCTAAVLILTGAAFGQSLETRTVFSIGNINGAGTYPLKAYAVTGDQLILSATWRPLERDGGPVGIGVDPINERMFISYEFSGTLDAFDATDATPLGQITLVSPDPGNPVDDICGLDVHEGRGQLFVVDRMVNYVYVFDSDTFDHVETWELPTGSGPFDVEIIEDLGGQDLIFVTDATTTIRWYDIDTHTEVGSATQGQVAVSLGVFVNDNDYPVLFSGTVAVHGLPHGPNLVKYDTEAGQQTNVQLGGGSARGIAVNQQNERVYANVGPALGPFGQSTVRVYSIDPFEELSRVTIEGFGLSPTDLDATWLAFGSNVKKESTSHPDGTVNMTEEVVFEITIENRDSRPIHVLPLKDIYNTAHLTYLFAEAPYTSDDNTDDGEIDWSDLIAQRGSDLAFEETLTVVAHFQAQPEACTNFVDGQNVAQMVGAENDLGDPVEDAAGSFAYRITCQCVTDADCDDGMYCNGTEICNDENQCESSGNPCPIDDGIFCNGAETAECIEATDECAHEGDPCTDDGQFCNGDSVCNEETLACDDTGNPCDEGEECNENIDVCESVDEPEPGDDDDTHEIDDDADEPAEGEVTGGCCGCG